MSDEDVQCRRSRAFWDAGRSRRTQEHVAGSGSARVVNCDQRLRSKGKRDMMTAYMSWAGRRWGMTMNLKSYGSIAALSAVVALGGATSTSLAATPQRAAAQQAYGCTTDPKLCQTGVSGIRVVGGNTGIPGSPGGTGTGTPGGTGATPGTGKNPGYATGTRSTGGNTGSGNTGKGTGGGKGTGAKALGSGAHGKGPKGAGANGSSPIPSHGLPVTGFGGTAQDLGASPRASAAGTQAVVVGLASSRSSKGVTALPATGGGLPSQPQSPLLAFLACGLAVLGLGLRKVATRL